VALQENDDW